MRNALTNLLNRRYPRVCGAGSGGVSFDHGDGWFAILDALLSVLESHRGVIVTGAEQKMAGLRVATQPQRAGEFDHFAEGAVIASEQLSRRICEQTGHPGRLVWLDGVYATLEPKAPQHLFEEPLRPLLAYAEPVRSWPGVTLGPEEPEPDLSEHDRQALSRRRSAILDIPPGWLRPVDALLAVILQLGVYRSGRAPPEVRSVRRGVAERGDAGRLVLDAGDLDECERGAIAFTEAVLRRAHIETSGMGPVDDRGLPAWSWKPVVVEGGSGTALDPGAGGALLAQKRATVTLRPTADRLTFAEPRGAVRPIG